jgi:hypothetical protein
MCSLFHNIISLPKSDGFCNKKSRHEACFFQIYRVKKWKKLKITTSRSKIPNSFDVRGSGAAAATKDGSAVVLALVHNGSKFIRCLAVVGDTVGSDGGNAGIGLAVLTHAELIGVIASPFEIQLTGNDSTVGLGSRIVRIGNGAGNRGLVLSANEPYSIFSPCITSLVNREVVGIITGIDKPDANPERVERWLRLAGCKKILPVSAYTGEGLDKLIEFLADNEEELEAMRKK